MRAAGVVQSPALRSNPPCMAFKTSDIRVTVNTANLRASAAPAGRARRSLVNLEMPNRRAPHEDRVGAFQASAKWRPDDRATPPDFRRFAIVPPSPRSRLARFAHAPARLFGAWIARSA